MRWALYFTMILLSFGPSSAPLASATENVNQSSAGELLDSALPISFVIQQHISAANETLSNSFNESKNLIARSNKDPEFREKLFTDVKHLIEYEFHRSHSLYRDQYIKIYDENLTRQEIQLLLSFYKTPTGQKMSRLAIAGAAHSDSSTQSGSVHAGRDTALDSIDESDLPAIEILIPLTKNPKFKIMTLQIQALSDKQHSEIIIKLQKEIAMLVKNSLNAPDRI